MRAACLALAAVVMLLARPARAQDDGFNPALAPSAPLNEEVVRLRGDPSRPAITLETTIYRPPGPGPFPLAVMMHGATHASAADRGERYRYTFSAYYFLSRGYEVALPMARGFAHSGGELIHVGCDSMAAGLANAADLAAVVQQLQGRPEVDRTRVVVAGQSYGGWTTMAYGGTPNPGVRGLVGFSPAIRESDCREQDAAMVDGMGRFGAAARLPSLWFYGDNDTLVPVATWRAMDAAYRRAGGKLQLVTVGRVGSDSHQMIGSGANLVLWTPALDAFLSRIGLPSGQSHPEFLPRPHPPPSHFAALEDVGALPLSDPRARDSYRQFLSRPLPRAFVIAPGRAASWSDGGFDPLARALTQCGQAQATCRPYAVDNEVVWVPPPAPVIALAKTVASGGMSVIAFASAVNPDCSPKPAPVLTVVTGPVHGAVAVLPGHGHPAFPAGNALAACNMATVPGNAITYRPEPGYAGPDSVTFEEQTESGETRRVQETMTVQ